MGQEEGVDENDNQMSQKKLHSISTSKTVETITRNKASGGKRNQAKNTCSHKWLCLNHRHKERLFRLRAWQNL